MRYGWVLPFGDARTAAELAPLAEEHGWDGFFVPDAVWSIDAWVALAAAAMRTERIRLGTMLTPVPRRKPWDLASQVATVDNLSGGRVILSVGLGAADRRWWLFEEDPGRRVRAELLDESLELMTLLWSGGPVRYQGEHYRALPADRGVPPPPAQRPRVPIWVVGVWPRPRSMRRTAAWDGWIPNYLPGDGEAELTPEVMREGIAWLRDRRAAQGLTMDGFDVVQEGTTEPGDAAPLAPWAEAGATWWLEADWSTMEPAKVRAAAERRLRAGPPALR